MTAWPYPGDAPLARARRVAHAYRAALLLADPDRCAVLDRTMTDWAQAWVVPRVVTVDPNEWISAADAADIAVVDPAQIRVWCGRGLLVGRKRGGRWEVRAGEVLALAASVRRRPGRGIASDQREDNDRGPTDSTVQTGT